MGDIDRVQPTSSEVERGAAAEVAAVGNALTSLFNTLGITQAAYALRVHIDKSAVSRYLSGRRLPPQSFIDRLMDEVEDHVGQPVQEQVKEAIRQQRLRALLVTNPAEYELESLRLDLDRSKRAIKTANRQVEALHILLDRKEQQLEDLAAEVRQVRDDWAASGASLLPRAADDAGALKREVRELRRDLAEAEERRKNAEKMCGDLRSRVISLEEELSQLPQEVDTAVPIGDFKNQLLALLLEEKNVEVAFELSSAARSRELSEALDVVGWLIGHEEGGRAEDLIVEAARFREIADVAKIGPAVVKQGNEDLLQGFLLTVVSRVSGDELSYLLGLWVGCSIESLSIPPYPLVVKDVSLADATVATVLSQLTEKQGLRVLSAVRVADQFASLPLTRAVAGSVPPGNVSLKLARGVDLIGWRSLARVIVGAHLPLPFSMVWAVEASHVERRWLYDLAAVDEGGWMAVSMANQMLVISSSLRSDELQYLLLEEFLDSVERFGSMKQLINHPDASAELREYLEARPRRWGHSLS
ncbi:helix-turn-helix domain-containing protein [Streptomyces lavendulae]|uniref:helix-turn-helix domain-containing protein n=1 Tax=Streptomyces lavendulae TaxID=1914 RepID=UPI0036E58A45